MNFYKIALLLVVSFSRSAQGEGCYPPPCAHGQFFCTHSGTDCCNLDSEFCSPKTKHCERALYNVTKGEEIMACCTFLTEEKGKEADYQRGSFEEGKLQVCKYLLGALTWEITCANLDIGTTAQPESSRSSATYNNPDITTRDASREGQGTVCNCPDWICYTFVVVIIVGFIIVIVLGVIIGILLVRPKVDPSVQPKPPGADTKIEEPPDEARRLDEARHLDEKKRLLGRPDTGNAPAGGSNRDEVANLARYRRSVSQIQLEGVDYKPSSI